MERVCVESVCVERLCGETFVWRILSGHVHPLVLIEEWVIFYFIIILFFIFSYFFLIIYLYSFKDGK